MSKKSAPPPQAPQPDEPEEYIANTEDACTDAAYKLVVAINLLKIESDRALDDDSDGGYGLIETIRILHDIRSDLQKSVAKAEQQRAAEKSGGAQ